MSVFLLVLGFFLIVCLIVIHEFGHFIVARRNNVEVEEFGIGFPPRAWHKKMKGNFDFSLNWLPLGGFVRMKGAHDTDTEKGGFGSASLWVKVKIMLAGVVMNVLAAFVILTILGFIGMPKLIDNQFSVPSNTKTIRDETLVGSVISGSPAAQIGLKQSDQLLKIGRVGESLQTVNSANTLPNLTAKYAGQKVTVVYKQGSTIKTTNTTLLSKSVVQASDNTNNPKGYLGIVPFEYTLQRSTWAAPVNATGIIGQFTELTYKGLGTAVKGLGSTIAGLTTGNKVARQSGQSEASSQVSGPIGIYFFLKYSSAIGIQFVLIIVAVLSLTLALINVLPIPALDGGRLFLILITRLVRKPMKQLTEDVVNGAGFAVLMALIVLISIVDVKRF